MILINSFSFTTRSTVAVQCKDGGPWTHNIVEEVNGIYHQGQSYIITVINSYRLIMHMRHTVHK